MIRTPFARALVVAALAAVCSGAHAFDRVVIFGDSLSDSGNNALALGKLPACDVAAPGCQVITGNTYIPSLPYGGNAYTDGTTWVNGFAAGLGMASVAVPSYAGGWNYAFGGARTTVNGNNAQNFPPAALTQVGMYLQAGTFTANSLAIVAIGGNDVRAAADAVAADPGNAGTIIAAAAMAYAAGVGQIVDTLQSAGAQHIVVWNAPNVGNTPAARAAGPAAQGAATFIASSMNGALAARLASETGVVTFDLFNAFAPVFVNPGAYGFTNTTDACGATVNNCDPASAVFWDGIHPTSAAHALIAQAMVQTVSAIPEPGSVVLMALGLAGVLVARRRQAAA